MFSQKNRFFEFWTCSAVRKRKWLSSPYLIFSKEYSNFSPVKSSECVSSPPIGEALFSIKDLLLKILGPSWFVYKTESRFFILTIFPGNACVEKEIFIQVF